MPKTTARCAHCDAPLALELLTFTVARPPRPIVCASCKGLNTLSPLASVSSFVVLALFFGLSALIANHYALDGMWMFLVVIMALFPGLYASAWVGRRVGGLGKSML